MAKNIKLIIFGVVIGALLAFPLGMNYGRGDPLLSNPFKKRDVTSKVKEGTRKLLEGTKEAIHEATKPRKREN